MQHKILFVDDDAHILDAYKRQLRKQFHVETAVGGHEALADVEQRSDPDFYAVAVADMRMPKMDGVEFLGRLRVLAPNTVRIMLTGNADQQTAIDAVNEGHIFRFLNKPCPPEVLGKTLLAAINQHELQIAEKELLEKTLTGSIRLVTDLISLSDPAAYARAIKLRNYIREVSEFLMVRQPAMGGQLNTWELEIAAMFSRIGLIALPVELQNKVRSGHSLTEDEAAAFSRVPGIGSDLIKRIPRLRHVAEIIRHQAEAYEPGIGSRVLDIGSDSNARDRIPETRDPMPETLPIGARLLKILDDVVEAESGGQSRREALTILKNRPGLYDPRLLREVEDYFAAATDSPERVSPRGPQSGVQIPLFIRDLRPGDQLVADVFGQDGAILFTAGHVVTGDCVESLNNQQEGPGVCEPVYVVPAG